MLFLQVRRGDRVEEVEVLTVQVWTVEAVHEQVVELEAGICSFRPGFDPRPEQRGYCIQWLGLDCTSSLEDLGDLVVRASGTKGRAIGVRASAPDLGRKLRVVHSFFYQRRSRPQILWPN